MNIIFKVDGTVKDSLNIIFNEAVKINELIIINYILKNKFKEITPIYAVEIATINGHIDLVKLLINNNIPIGPNSLTYAIENGSLELVKYFIEEHAFTIYKNDFKRTIKLKHFYITNYLLEKNNKLLELDDINNIIHCKKETETETEIETEIKIEIPYKLIDFLYNKYTFLIDKNFKEELRRNNIINYNSLLFMYKYLIKKSIRQLICNDVLDIILSYLL